MTETPDSDFAALGAPAPLAAALRARDYLTPTPVQARVLEAPEQDLLVSSQTGSGKTVAFGLIIARVLLGHVERVTVPASALWADGGPSELTVDQWLARFVAATDHGR